MREGVEEVGLSQALVLHPHPLDMQIRGDKLESLLPLLRALPKVQTYKKSRRGREKFSIIIGFTFNGFCV